MINRSIDEIPRIRDNVKLSEANKVHTLIEALGIKLSEPLDLAWFVATAYYLGKADAIAEGRRAKREASTHGIARSI